MNGLFLSVIPMLSVAFLSVAALRAEEPRRGEKERPSFGLLAEVSAKEAQTRAQSWLEKTGKMDDQAFSAIWSSDRPVLERVAHTLALGNDQAAQLLAQANNPDVPAPTEVPALLKDKKVDRFLQANLAVAYARALANRRIFEEALGALDAVQAEDVVDPGAYLFCKAVCEHSLMLKEDAEGTIDRLLVDMPTAPERYRMVGALMHFDMLTWREKDLGWVARKMGVIKDRLDLTRGGKKTQRMQKEVVVRLDEMIKELENQQKSGGG
jgi:hypothetical protein